MVEVNLKPEAESRERDYTSGVDLAKRLIQVHAVEAAGRVVTVRMLERDKFAPWCAHLPPGCAFAPRCNYAMDRCHKEDAPEIELGNGVKSLTFDPNDPEGNCTGVGGTLATQLCCEGGQ